MGYTSLIKEVDIPELVKALRHCMAKEDGITICEPCPYYGKGIECENVLHTDAADAIEALQAAEPTEKQVVDYCHNRCLVVLSADLFYELKASYGKLPKRGEWIWDDKRCIYVCSVCGSPKVRENMDRQILKEQAYCYSCGAKMEVQDG